MLVGKKELFFISRVTSSAALLNGTEIKVKKKVHQNDKKVNAQIHITYNKTQKDISLRQYQINNGERK